MRNTNLPILGIATAIFCLLGISTSRAQDYFYVGSDGGDFYDEANWNSVFDSTDPATSLTNLGDVLIDDSSGAIPVDLVVDASSALHSGFVFASGQVDFGDGAGVTGSLSLLNGANFIMSGAGADLDFNAGSDFTLTNSTLNVDGDIVFEGLTTTTGGTITSVTDDIEFQELGVYVIDGTTFSSGDNTFFDGFLAGSSIANAEFFAADRFGLRQNVNVVMTDSLVSVNAGNGDVDNVINGNVNSGATLTLLGSSSLIADTVEEEVNLVLDDTSSATLAGLGGELLDNGSTITLLSTDAQLTVAAAIPVDTPDVRNFLINGLGGQTISYLTDPNSWNDNSWDGLTAVTLQVVNIPVPEPTSYSLLLVAALGCCWGSRSARVFS